MTSSFPTTTFARPIRKISLAFCLAAALTFAPAAFAERGVTHIADDGQIAVATYSKYIPSRGQDVTKITLIYGANFMTGELVDKESGPVTLKASGPAQDRYVFSGTINLKGGKNLITLKGKMTAGGMELETFDTKLKSKVLNPGGR